MSDQQAGAILSQVRRFLDILKKIFPTGYAVLSLTVLFLGRLTYNSSRDVLKILVMPTKVHEAVGNWLVQEPLEWARAATMPPRFSDFVDLVISPSMSLVQGERQKAKYEISILWQRGEE